MHIFVCFCNVLTWDHLISVHRGAFFKRDVLGGVVQQQEPAGEPEPYLLREPAVGSPATASGQSSQPVLSCSRGAEGRSVPLLWSLFSRLRGQEIVWAEKRHRVRKKRTDWECKTHSINYVFITRCSSWRVRACWLTGVFLCGFPLRALVSFHSP